MSQYGKYSGTGSGGGAGTVTAVTGSAPIASSGGTTPDISIDLSNIAPLASPAFTGVPTAPTAAPATSTTQLATTAFVQSQGFVSVAGPVPASETDNASAQTSASTVFVNALTTTVTLTTTAKILVNANATFTTTTAASVAGLRVTVNAVASRAALITLTALTTNYLGSVQYVSASLAPGTYTVNFDFQRNSGTGTVNYVSGTLNAVGLQGTNSNGITQLTGALQAGPGSGSQALTGTLPVANGGTGLTTYSANRILFAPSAGVISQVTGGNSGALVTSAAGLPSITLGTTANRLLRTNGTTVSFAQAVLTTDVSGVLPAANGGTGHGVWAANQVPFGNGTSLVGDPLFIFTTANTRFSVGQGGGTGRMNGVVSLTDPTPNDLAGNFFSRTTANNCVNIQNENTLITLNMTNSGGTTVGANILSESSRGTLVARTQSQVGDALFTLAAHGRTASAWSTGLAASLAVVTTDVVTDATNGGEMVFSVTPTGAAAPVERLRIAQAGDVTLVNAHLKSTQTTAPTTTIINAGGGATATVTNATDRAGHLELVTGAGATAGQQCTVNFNRSYAVAPIVMITPTNENAADFLSVVRAIYVTSTVSGFSINFKVGDSGGPTTYSWNYTAEGTQ